MKHGDIVKYNGYKTVGENTINAICTAVVYGWDENFVYTGIKLANENDRAYGFHSEETNTQTVWTDSRSSFHISRLIGAIEWKKIKLNELKQGSLF